MCENVCVGFVDLMLNCKGLSDYTNFCSPNEYEENDPVILRYFQ